MKRWRIHPVSPAGHPPTGAASGEIPQLLHCYGHPEPLLRGTWASIYSVSDTEPNQGAAGPAASARRTPQTEASSIRASSIGLAQSGLARRLAGNWHLLALGGWTTAWFTILIAAASPGSSSPRAAGYSSVPAGPGFPLAAACTCASHPQLQIGPLSFVVAQVLRHIGPDQGLVAAQIALTAVGLILVPAIAGIATEHPAGPRRPAGQAALDRARAARSSSSPGSNSPSPTPTSMTAWRLPSPCWQCARSPRSASPRGRNASAWPQTPSRGRWFSCPFC